MVDGPSLVSKALGEVSVPSHSFGHGGLGGLDGHFSTRGEPTAPGQSPFSSQGRNKDKAKGKQTTEQTAWTLVWVEALG